MDSKKLAKKIRIHALRMANRGKSSHIGSALSIADIVAVLYTGILNVDPNTPDMPDRDRFILSKGHAGSIVYAALAECGFFSLEELGTHYQNGSNLSGHISHLNNPGIEVSTGSLGHGLSIGAGMAFSAMLDDMSHKVFVLMSDGECDEGSNWEAILFASHHGLENLIAVVDYNKLQSIHSISETLELEPFSDKWRSFGWAVQEIDGHDHGQIRAACRALPLEAGKPNVIIAHTVKGRGVSFMENQVLWHYRCPQGEEFDAALAELSDL